MKTRRLTRRVVRQYVPPFRRASDADLRVYWLRWRDVHGENAETRLIADLAFREIMRRKRAAESAA